MKLFLCYLKYKKKTFALCLLFIILFAATFYLYHLPLKAVWYPSALCFVIGVIFLLADFLKVRKKHNILKYLEKMTAELIGNLPESDSIADEDYQKIIAHLCEEQRRRADEAQARYNDMVDYYTVWAHQIKTPIAAMRLNLQNEDSPFSRKLQNDLNRIESYVNMVLTFLRLESDSTDYVIREYDLDSIVRSAVRKFSGEFIGKKLSLEYEGVNAKVLTDEKWLSFVVEQVLSNAVKYTGNGGTISVYMEEPKTLCIKDTGIGIAPEDLPRIFKNGYTGFNGRADKRASGIGLYLCKRVCDNLGHGISAESKVGSGTVIRINLDKRQLEVE